MIGLNFQRTRLVRPGQYSATFLSPAAYQEDICLSGSAMRWPQAHGITSRKVFIAYSSSFP